MISFRCRRQSIFTVLTDLMGIVIISLVLAGTISAQVADSRPPVSTRPIRRPDLAAVPDQSARKISPTPSAARVGRLQYDGGGDWYWGSSAIPNFTRFIRDHTDIPVDTLEKAVRLTDPELSAYPFLFATGHGVIRFSEEEKEHLRAWLEAGGFLFVNDSYGMAEGFLKEMKEIFPEREVVEPPFDHPIYHILYDFPSGPPKIHEHDGKAPRGYAIMVKDRIAVYFLVESDIGDGWEDPQVHNDPPEKREAALKMGANLLAYAMLY